MNEIAKQILDARILVVDDKQENVDLLEMMLEFAGYENVRSTTDSRRVKGLCDEHDFDLILLDIRMPHLDGVQVMQQLSNNIEDDYLPVLVLTAQRDMETRLRALAAGAKDFVTKPFDKFEVLNRISNMLEVRSLYNERKNQAAILEVQVAERTRELRDRNDELEETRLEIIRRLGRAGEYRDNETGMHVMRMSKTCERLAHAAGMDMEFSEMILKASPMHDVGKIGIPDNILLKPGRLEPDEFTIMKTHVEIGVDIIGDFESPIMQMAREIALGHHEKWDGGGYPSGLAGEDIPVSARIAAVADVFDALTSERPYKQAWPIEKAVAFMNENAGSHFEPRLVDLFNVVIDDILAIREKYADEK